MQFVKESILVSSIRSFFSALLAMVGILIGILAISAALGALSKTHPTAADGFDMEILPDAKDQTDLLPESAPVILQVDIKGIIGDQNLYGEMVEAILRSSRKGVLKHDRVKAILLYIDSPGGTVIDSDIIYKALLRYKEQYKVPVYAYVPGLCASGGYYIACSADKIYGSEVSIVGSVGTLIGPFFNFWDFMASHGLTSMTLTQGKYKQKYPSFSKLPTEEPAKSESYKDLIDIAKESYMRFVSIVSNVRSSKGLTEKLLIDTYGARVFLGNTATKYGYLDSHTLSYKEVLTELVQTAGISSDSPYQVVHFYPKRSPVQELLSGQLSLWHERLNESLFGIPSSKRWDNQFLYYYNAKERLN